MARRTPKAGRGRRKGQAAAVAAMVVAGALGFFAGGLRYGGVARVRETAPVASLRAALGHGRGIDAAAPQEVPLLGWLDVLKRVVLRIGENRLMQEAAGVTFYTLLAIFPTLTATVSLYGLVADPADIQRLVSALRGVIPDGGLTILHGQLHTLTHDTHGLTTGFAVGLAAALWSSNQGSKALFEALNVVYREDEKRSYPYFVVAAMAFTFGAILFVIIALVAVVALPELFKVFRFSPLSQGVFGWLRWPIILVVVSAFLSALYRFGPSREDSKWRWVSWGGALASLSWVGVSFTYSWYVQNFGSFDQTYGSLGAAVGFMVWIWLSTLVALAGAQLNSELEHQTARDTTTGPPKPLGFRGSTQSDTVA